MGNSAGVGLGNYGSVDTIETLCGPLSASRRGTSAPLSGSLKVAALEQLELDDVDGEFGQVLPRCPANAKLGGKLTVVSWPCCLLLQYGPHLHHRCRPEGGKCVVDVYSPEVPARET